MPRKKFKVGIVGLQPERSWAAHAHVPALHALADDFEMVGVANTSLASAKAAADAAGIPRAFSSVAEMVASAEVDIVSVTVKVPHHLSVVRAAIEAGKHVYCEWPLGNGLAEAQEITALAAERGVLGVVGNQARMAPEIRYLRVLLDEGYVGEVLSTTIVARSAEFNSKGFGWGATVINRNRYLLDKANGATMLTVPIGHTLAAFLDILGDFSEISAVIANRRTAVLALDTGEILPKTAPDQVLVSGMLASGAPVSLHYRGGPPRHPIGFEWEINGTEGDIRVTAASGHIQMVPLTLMGARGDGGEIQRIEVPASYNADFPGSAVVGNVARVYASMAFDLRNGTRSAPTFADAMHVHRILAMIDQSAEGGHRISVPS